MASKFNNLNEQRKLTQVKKTYRVIGIAGQSHTEPVKQSQTIPDNNVVKIDKKKEPVTVKPKIDKSNNDTGNIIIFVGGRDDRKDKVTGKLKDKPLDEQTSLLQTNVTGDIIPFRYTPISSALASLTNHPDATVILFSAGCAGAMFFAKAMADPTKLYIVEPYALSGSTTKSVRAAVTLGTPKSNVYVGNIPGRGLGIVEGASTMPTLKGGTMPSHWNALKEIGKLI
jgi:hypothetical protein